MSPSRLFAAHGWACNYLDTTGDIFGAAMMLGTSVKMLQTRYLHMDMDKLHEQYLQFMADKAGPPQAANDNHPHSAHGEDRRRFVRR